MNWIKTISNVLSKAVKFTAFAIVIAETLQFLAEKLEGLSTEKTDSNDK